MVCWAPIPQWFLLLCFCRGFKRPFSANFLFIFNFQTHLLDFAPIKKILGPGTFLKLGGGGRGSKKHKGTFASNLYLSGRHTRAMSVKEVKAPENRGVAAVLEG